VTIAVEISPGTYGAAVESRLQAWTRLQFGRRIWAKDTTLWSEGPAEDISNRLGWLDLPDRIPAVAQDLSQFGQSVRDGGFDHVVVLGMGGSSLAPEVYQAVLGNADDYPRLFVLDSTHPGAIQNLEDQIEIARTLFVVSSKSGTTLETISFFRYFWEKVALDAPTPGSQFIAVTDSDSALDTLAADRNFRRAFHAPSDVGGRYSALCEFGLLPAAAIGVDLDRLHAGAARAASRCGAHVEPRENPALLLGAFLGELAAAGRNKATFVASPRLRPLVAWIEQLVAESTGKQGTGIVPIGGDEGSQFAGMDRATVILETTAAPLDDENERAMAAGDPVARLRLGDVWDLGGAMFVLEMAVAAAGAILRVNPFDQPDVELGKMLARESMSGDLPGAASVASNVLDGGFGSEISTWLRGAIPPLYVSIQAYLPPTPAVATTMETARRLIRDRTGLATTFAFGPRFLHSTGQLHKGGPPGLCLQLVDRPLTVIGVPETDFTFGDLIEAQALGDENALRIRGQEVLTVDLGDSGALGLEALLEALAAARPS
jgi:transaldolase/glucose-6-phosphate isomerase